ncbi:MAG: sensor domain-containing diguanylate cyclase [bacterium]|nr:sensor domain-containing diguanylate cyclase [bacterium]
MPQCIAITHNMNKLAHYKDILFSTLSEITSLIIAGKDKKLIFQRLLDCCLTVLGAERVYLLELEGEKVIRYSISRNSSEGDDISVESVSAVGIKEWVIKEGSEQHQFAKGEELAVDLPSVASHYLDGNIQNRSIISAPLVANRTMFGLLVAIHPTDGGLYSTEDIRLVTILSNQAAIALENRQLYQKLEKEAITDDLTSVYNYRFLMNSLKTELKRARRFGQIFSFVMLDVDNLKQYNDRLGHLSGSQALKEVAHLIKLRSREIDLISKYGGDEFGILLPQTGLTGGRQVIRRVLDSVAEHCFDGDESGLITCSAGISCFPQDGTSVRELIAGADRALYEAKRRGKNRVLTTHDLLVDVRD